MIVGPSFTIDAVVPRHPAPQELFSTLFDEGHQLRDSKQGEIGFFSPAPGSIEATP